MSPGLAPTIIHADMDAFYAAVEQHDHPELRGKPVIVGGIGNRGVVSTASYEARKFGVHSAMPSLQARQLCPQGIFVPGRMERYVEVGRQVRAVFEEFTPEVEPLSLDEAFLDVTNSLTLFGSARHIAERLRQRVREVTGLAVSVGIGPIKMVAKIASGLCKPDGLLEVRPDEVAAFLRPLSVDYIWGAGPTTCAALERLGIRTIGELADSDPHMLERRLGSFGPTMWALARGDDARTVEPDRQRKSYGEEQTFDRDLRDGTALRRIIVAQAEAVARRLRDDSSAARTVTLKIKLAQRIGPGKFQILTRRTTLPDPVDDGAVIARTALALWDTLREGRVIRLVGVAVSSIESTQRRQLSLFQAETQRRSRLNRAVDTLADRFGSDIVQRADAVGVKSQAARSLGERTAMTTSKWSPEQYERFRDERRQPFFDLMNLVQATQGMRVVDLGCGTGELTRILHDDLRASETVGIDSSDSMLAQSTPLATSGLRFEIGDIASFHAAESYDLVFSNAALQWIDDHPALLRRLTVALSDNGQLAVQVPANHDHVSHRVAADIAQEEPFRSALHGYARHSSVLLPEQYTEILDGLGYSQQHVRLQVYAHHLSSRDDVVEWTKGTLLVAYQERLSAELFAQFLARYRTLLLPQLADTRPYLYPFKRILFWGRR